MNSQIVKVNTSGIISTVAGPGTTTIYGDGGPATDATISAYGIVLDRAGNLYMGCNSSIRMINASGIINTISGSTTSTGFSGDGGPATAALFFGSHWVATDSAGNLYIADELNQRVRKINTAGIINTIAGSGVSGSGSTAGGYSGDSGPATSALLKEPSGVAVDGAGNTYIADYENNRIRKVDTAGIITTIAGSGATGLYMGSYSGDNCAATAATMNAPVGIAVDRAGNIYVSDYYNYRIRKISRDHAPHFINGHSQALGMCVNATDSINTLLAIIDTDDGQGEMWSAVSAPAHGSLTASYSTTSTGGIVTTTGLYYTPASGYTSNDSFKVQVTDCAGVADTTTVYVTVFSSPALTTITGANHLCTGASIAMGDTVLGGVWSSSSSSLSIGSATGIITGIVAGTATITYSLSLSCGSAVVTKVITVNPTPSIITGTAAVCSGLTTTLSDSLSGGAWSSPGSSGATVGSTGIVTGVAAGIATISYTMPTGCKATIPVTVNPLPSVITGTLNVCAGLTTTLSDSASGGAWSSPGGLTIGSATGVVMGVTAGTSLITYTLPTGCIKTTAITVNPLPSAITGSINVCVGNNISLSDSTSSGAWSSSNANASIGSAGIVTGVAAGNDTIKYTLPTGCIATRPITVNPLPSSITGASSVCTGQTTTLTNGAGSGAWSSSVAATAAIGSTGLLSGIAAGTATITYTLPTGCRTSVTVTVNPLPSLITGTLNVCVGANTTLSDSTIGGAWSSGAPLTASVGSTGIVHGLLAGTAPIAYTNALGCAATATVTVNATPATIGGSGNVCKGATTTLYDGSSGGTWSSSNTLVATIGSAGVAAGMVSGVASGSALIYYSYPTGCSVFYLMVVNPSPSLITGSSLLCVGSTAPFSDSIGGGSWSSSNYDTAYIDASSGLVTGIAAGPATITYTAGISPGCFTTTTVNVNAAPSVITSTTGSSVCAGSAVPLYNSVSGGVWSSSAPLIAAVGSSSGIVTGLVHGNTVISYSTGTGCTVTFPMTVNPSPIAITGPVSVCKGSVITITDSSGTSLSTGGVWSSPGSTGIAVLGSTTSLSATITGTGAGLAIISYTIGGTSAACAAIKLITVNPLPATITGTLHVCPAGTTTLSSGTGGIWNSASSLLTIGSATGTVTGIAHGAALVSYTLPTGCASTVVVTVNPLPALISGSNSVCVGLTTSLTDSTTTGTWTKSNADVNIGSATGVVTGVTPGTTNIFYTLPFTGCYVTKTITVNTSPGAITGLTHVCPGASIVLGNAITGGTWASGNTGIATVIATGSGAGTVTGVSPGPVTITYSIGAGCSVSATITVNPLPAIPIAIGTGTIQVCPGQTTILSDSTTGGTWGSSAGSLLTVGSSTGIVTGVSGGAAVITYTSSIGCMRTAIVTVNPSPLSISGPSAVCIGSTISLTDPGGGTWSSSASLLTVGSSTGVVTGDSLGTATITYTLPTGCTTSKTVTVSLSPTAITGPSTVCQGATISLGDLVGGGLWSGSAGAAVGSISGVVTGITPGASTTITYSLGSGCTVTKTVSVIAAPAAIIGAGGVCVGSSISLTDATSGGTWHSSTSGATVGSAGTVTGVSAGTASISYTVAATGCPAIAVITVNPTPGAITGPSGVCAGATINEADTSAGGIWSTASTNISIGGAGTVTGLSSGPATITYTTGIGTAGCIATKTVTVNTISPITGATGLCMGTSTALTDAAGGGSWSTPTGGVVTIAPTGVVTAGMATGAAIITYSLGTGCTTTTTVNVNTGPSPIGGTLQVCVGDTTWLNDLESGGTWSPAGSAGILVVPSTGAVVGVTPGTDTVAYSLGTGCTVKAAVTVNASPAAITGTPQVCVDATTALGTTATGGLWTSSPGTIATVTPSGSVSGVSAGIATVSYTAGSCSATKTVTVNATPSAITGTAAVCMGMTTNLTDTTSPGTGIWSTGSASGIATVDPSGLVTGVFPGTALVSYTLPTGCAATKTVTVNSAPDPITGLTGICIGATTALSDFTTGGTWSSPGTTSIVSLSPTGVVTGTGLGTAAISYSVGAASCPAVITVTVNSLPGPIGGSPNVCLGTTDTLTDLPGGGVWSSSNILVTTIGSANGVLSGVAPGTATIYYSLGAACTVNRTVTVHPSPAAISGPTNVCAGHTATLSDPAPGGIWSSGGTAIATISPAGVVTGVTGGIATITCMVPIGSGISCPATYAVAVTEVPAIMGISNMCAYGATLHVSDSMPGGAWTSTLVSISPAGVVTSYGAGAATIYYTLSSGCYVEAPLTVNPLPNPVTGNQRVCTGLTTTLGELTTGGTWSSSDSATASPTAAGIVTGMTPGTATISYTLPTGCMQAVTVTVSSLPSVPVAAGSGAANLCVGASMLLGDVVPGGTWSTITTGIVSVGSVSGVVTGLSAGTANITYTVAPACAATKTVTVNPLPAVYNVTGGGNYCSGGAGMAVGLSGTQAGTGYQLYLGTAMAGSAVTGTGGVLSFGPETAAGVYKATATTAAGCTNAMADSAVIIITATVNPTVSITTTPGDTLCAGTAATFTATATNGGATPAYQWQVNSTPLAGATTAAYTYTPANGDMVTALLTSDATCATPDTVSRTTTITVDPELLPVVSINAHPGTTILTGENDTLSVTWTGAGTSPTYQWYVNGTAVPGATNATYTSNNLAGGDSVSCTVTPQGPCGQPGTNGVKITTFDNVGVPFGKLTMTGEPSIWPNPAKGQLNVINAANTEMKIVNLLGQQVWSGKLTMANEVVNIGALVPGIYVVEIVPFDKLTMTTVMRLVIAQ